MTKKYEKNILDTTGNQFTLAHKLADGTYRAIYTGGGVCKAFMWDYFYAFIQGNLKYENGDPITEIDPKKVYIHFREQHYLDNKPAIPAERAEEILTRINDAGAILGFKPTKLVRLTNHGILIRPKDSRWFDNLYYFSLFLSAIRFNVSPDAVAYNHFLANPNKLKEKAKEFTGTLLENWHKYNGHACGVYELYRA